MKCLALFAVLTLLIGIPVVDAIDIEGSFTIALASKEEDNGEQVVVPLPESRDVTFRVTKQQQQQPPLPTTTTTYMVSIHAGNYFSGPLQVDDDDDASILNIGPMATTLMWPPPEFRPIEEFLGRDYTQMKTVSTVQEDESKLIRFEGPNGRRMDCRQVEKNKAIAS